MMICWFFTLHSCLTYTLALVTIPICPWHSPWRPYDTFSRLYNIGIAVSYTVLILRVIPLPACDSEDMDQSCRRISLSHLGNRQSFAWFENV